MPPGNELHSLRIQTNTENINNSLSTNLPQVVVLCLMAWLFYRALLLRTATPADSAIAWDRKNTFTYPLWCTLAGVLAGTFGMGGGSIMKGRIVTFFMIQLGVEPQIASATSATMAFFAACQGLVVNMFLGAVVVDYAIALGVLSAVCATIGKCIQCLILRGGRQSIILFILAFVMAFSCLGAVVQAVVGVVEDRKTGKLWETQELCPAVVPPLA